MDITTGKAALFIAHPGHVLRAYRWLEIAKPLVFVMTDGSGPDQPARLPSTSAVLEKVGARAGGVYGKWTDVEVYEAILKREAGPFVEATRKIANELAANEIDYILGDAAEGYQCTHEMCRYMLNTALALVEKETGRKIQNYDFLLFGPPDTCPDALRDRAIRVELNDDDFARKIAAAESYNEDFTHEVTKQTDRYGKKPFMVEYLMPAERGAEWHAGRGTPTYEVYGELQVMKGKYKQVIRYADHFKPLVTELRTKLGVA